MYAERDGKARTYAGEVMYCKMIGSADIINTIDSISQYFFQKHTIPFKGFR